MQTLFEGVGEQKLLEVITAFYDKAFKDPMICHFFFGKNQAHLTKRQISFSSVMLGSKNHSYTGKPLKKAHSGLPLKNPHFDRRQVLMRETLSEHGVCMEIAKKWLELEENLRPLIVNTVVGCKK